ncbi:uncharacterized protein LOC115219095 [Octopus sinensis]|uniref:Uncharacterized protein LOC115219095 n=1 Tax=Octopus sinensis TaxID=2607531 RepID=A0A6P7T2N5_9MOLL|nr:uncharacterized protein LOC115219095 [Octopus sinensis]
MGTVLQEREQNDYCIKKPYVIPTRSGVGGVRGRSKITSNAMTTATAGATNNNTFILIPPSSVTNILTVVNNNCNIGSLIKACEEEKKGKDGCSSDPLVKTSVVGVLNSDFNHHPGLVLPRSNALGRLKLIFPSSFNTTNNNIVTAISTTITTTINTSCSPTNILACWIKACKKGERNPHVTSSDTEDPRLNYYQKLLNCPVFCEESSCRVVLIELLVLNSLQSSLPVVTDTTDVAVCNNFGYRWCVSERGLPGHNENPLLKLNSHRSYDNVSRLSDHCLLLVLSYDCETCLIEKACACCHHYRQLQHLQQPHGQYHHKISNSSYTTNYSNKYVYDGDKRIINNKNKDCNFDMYNSDGKNKRCKNNNRSINHCYATNNEDCITATTPNNNNRNINICTATTINNNSIHATTTTNAINYNHNAIHTINTSTTNNNSHTTNTNRNRKPQSLLFSLYHQFVSAFFLHSVLSSYNVIFVAFTMVSLGMLPTTSQALHLQGVWKSDNFFVFLAKFGFQKTDLRDLEHTQGIIYGQVFSNSKNPISAADQHSSNPMLTLVLVDSEYFMEYYGNRTSHDLNRCSRMFDKIDTIAFDYKCRPKGLEDFLRKVPCSENQMCVDEDDPKDVIDGFQFTYRIRDLERPRFWYLSLAACHRNSGQNSQNKSMQCKWWQSPKDIEIAYDIWLVNGHPSMKHINPFEHQFSFELHDVAEIYLIALLLYCILLGTWLRAYNKLIKHPVTKLLTLTIVLEMVGILLNCIHVIKFAFDGVGVNWLSVVGNGTDVLAECLFMLLVLVIAKGWAITNMYLEGKWVIFSIWGLYTVLNAVLFVWNLTEIDIISNTGEWHTGPGYLTLVFRLTIMLWFLYELRWTFLNDPQSKRLLFFQHFGAGILVWFVYLPVLVMVSLQISALWRYKTILSISFAANFLSAVCIVHLLWPSHSVLYLIKQDELIGAYEMEVTGFLEDPENSLASEEILEEERFEKHSKKQDSSSLLKSLSKNNGQAPSEDKELLLD